MNKITNAITKAMILSFELKELKELKKIKNFKFRKIINKIKETKTIFFSCPICGNKDPYYATNIKHSKTKKLFQIKKVCSFNCLKEYLNQNVKNNSPPKIDSFIPKGLEQVLIIKIAGSLSFKEIEQIKPFHLKAAIKEIITQCEEKNPCAYCQQPEKGWELSLDKANYNDYKNVLAESFCSKKCLKKYFNEKIN